MVLKILLLVLALGLLALSLLTAVRVPVAVNWKWTLVAGGFGCWLAGVVLILAAAIWLTRGSAMGVTMIGLLICAFAIGLFLKPVVEAWQIAQALPARLQAAFGGGPPDRAAFSLGQLFEGRPPVVPLQTREYAPGLSLDFRRPANARAAVPCVIVIHGGGWDSGDRREISFFNDWLVSRGWAVAAIDYRLAPAHPWPAQRDDVRAAIDWLKIHADELGIDAHRLVLFGRSAGGQIASAVGFTAHDPDIRGVISLYAPQDMPFVWSISRDDDALNSLKLMRQYLGGPPDESRAENYRTASAQLNVDVSTPPTLLLHGTIDTLVWRRHSERLAARLAEAGRPQVFVELPWAGHAFEYNLAGPGGQLTTHAVDWFLRAVTADHPRR